MDFFTLIRLVWVDCCLLVCVLCVNHSAGWDFSHDQAWATSVLLFCLLLLNRRRVDNLMLITSSEVSSNVEFSCKYVWFIFYRCSSMCRGGISLRTRWWARSSHSAPRASSFLLAQPSQQRLYSGLEQKIWHLLSLFRFQDVHNVLLVFSIKLQIHCTGASSCPIWRPLQGGWSWVHHLRHCHWDHYQTIVKRNHWDPCHRGCPC